MTTERYAQVKLDELHYYVNNPRRGNVDVIAKSLQLNGQYRPIVVNKGTLTQRSNEVLAGNHTLQAAHQLGWTYIDCWLIDVDDEQAARIVAADNRTAELGSFDDQALFDLLDSLNDLDGTGYLEADLEELRRTLAEPIFDPMPNDDVPSLDTLNPRLCQKCGYDTANNPDGLIA